jgi:hypothetical protein
LFQISLHCLGNFLPCCRLYSPRVHLLSSTPNPLLHRLSPWDISCARRHLHPAAAHGEKISSRQGIKSHRPASVLVQLAKPIFLVPVSSARPELSSVLSSLSFPSSDLFLCPAPSLGLRLAARARFLWFSRSSSSPAQRLSLLAERPCPARLSTHRPGVLL